MLHAPIFATTYSVRVTSSLGPSSLTFTPPAVNKDVVGWPGCGCYAVRSRACDLTVVCVPAAKFQAPAEPMPVEGSDAVSGGGLMGKAMSFFGQGGGESTEGTDAGMAGGSLLPTFTGFGASEEDVFGLSK